MQAMRRVNPEGGEAENVATMIGGYHDRKPALNRSYAMQLNRLSDTAMEE